MSIFKVKQCWSNEALQSEEYEEGIQNSCCVKVDKFNSHDSDCIITAEGRQLKIYKPSTEQNETHVILESQLSDVILQIETGKFVPDSGDRQILVLHPLSYTTYFLEKKHGYLDAGDQNSLWSDLSHSFTRKAYSVTVGPFGVNKSRDLICIQALDGTLSFFDQDVFLFMCVFDDVIVPGPVSYVANSDLFIICKSTWIMEIYSYQQLRDFSELSGSQNKKNIPQWAYSPGEEISAVQVIRTSSNFSSIIALGERYLYCFQDNGLMKYMLRFDFMPVCFHAYLVGWYYEPNSRLLVMVVSDDSKLYIFEETKLLWSCALQHQAISISRCFLKNLPGGLVTLSPTGIVSVSYLGTEPDLNSTIVPMTTAPESEDLETDLENVEKELERILENKDTTHKEELIKINIEVGKPVETFVEDYILHQNITNCALMITLTCENPKQIQSIQITASCKYPLFTKDSTVCLEDINGTEIIELRVFLAKDMDLSDTNMKILIAICDASGRMNVMTKYILLPILFYANITSDVEENEFKLVLTTNQEYLSLDNIFSDLPQNSKTAVFMYKNTNKTVTIQQMNDHYIVGSDDCTEIYPILYYLLNKLNEYYTNMGIENCNVTFNTTSEVVKYIIHRFLKCVEIHAKERMTMNSLENELNTLQSQFTLIQKKLLIQYGALPPGNCDGLEFLMRDTHTSIVDTAQSILATKERVIRASCEISSVGLLILCVLKHSGVDENKINILKETLSLETFHEDIQAWEESVTQASSYILNTILKKGKDKEKLVPITDQDILSQVNIKRFLKQTKLILESMFVDSGKEVKENITRIEEFVEVI